MITVEKTERDVRGTIPNEAVPPKRLNAFLDSLRPEEVAQRSRLGKREADRLAEETKAAWWAANKAKLIPPPSEARKAGLRGRGFDRFLEP